MVGPSPSSPPTVIVRDDWTTSSPRIQAEEEPPNGSNAPLPVATFIRTLFQTHASELGSRFSKSHHFHRPPHKDEDDAYDDEYHGPIMDGGEFHVVDGKLLQVVTAHTLEEDYPSVTSTSPSHRRDRSRHYNNSGATTASTSCLLRKDQSLLVSQGPNHWARKFMTKAKHKNGKGGKHKQKQQQRQRQQQQLYGTRLNKNKSRSSKNKQHQGHEGDFSMRPGKGRKTRGGGSKKGRHEVPDPHMGGMHTYRPHLDDDGVLPPPTNDPHVQYYYPYKEEEEEEEVLAPIHQHMTRTVTAYPVYQHNDVTPPVASTNRTSSASPPPSAFHTANNLLNQSLESIQQLSCMMNQGKDETEGPVSIDGGGVGGRGFSLSVSDSLGQEDELHVLKKEIEAIDEELALEGLEEEEDDPTMPEDLSFDHFIQGQTSILQESDDWEQVSFPKDDADEEEEEYLTEPTELALGSVSSVETTNHVKNMIETFEAGARGSTPEVATPSLRVLPEQEDNEEYAVSMVQAMEEEATVIPPSTATAVTTKSQVTLSIPQDGYVTGKKILVVGSPQSGKTCLIESLTGSSEDDTKKRRFQMNTNRDGRLNCGVNVKSWTPASTTGRGRNIRYSLWELPGSSFEDGLHPSTQSVYFTPNSLHIVVWDISAIDGSHEDYEYYDDLMEQHENRIDQDIHDKVIFWIDVISARVKGCAILPVVTHREKLDESEVERRTSRLMDLLDDCAPSANIVFNSKGKIPLVSSIEDQGASELESAILHVMHNFPFLENQIETRIPKVIVAVQRVVERLKAKGHMIEHLFDIQREVYTELGIDSLGLSHIIEALKVLSSAGSIIYFGLDGETDILSKAVILDPRWISSALSCILRHNLPGKLKLLKKRKSKSAIKNDEIDEYHEAFKSENSDVAVVAHADTSLLWDSRYSMKQVKEKFDLNHNFALYQYLRTLCERQGIFVPFTTSAKENSPTFYLLPSLFKKVPEDNWSYKPSLAHKTTLCQSWVFNDGIPKDLIDIVIVSVLKGLFHMHDTNEYLYHAKVAEIKCRRNAFSARIVEVFSDQNRKKTNIIKIHVRVVDKNSAHCVNSNQMVLGEKKLIVSATGNEGNDGDTIWKLGYGQAIDRVEEVIEDFDNSNIEREVICPECLRFGEINSACSFCHKKLSMDQNESECKQGHRVRTSLMLGQKRDVVEIDESVSVSTMGLTSIESMASIYDSPGVQNLEELLESVVLVGLWDKDTQEIKSIGSGFIGDAKRGFIVTASHIFYENPVGKEVGPIYHGLKNGKAVIGVIPKTVAGNESTGASFTYCADIIAQDLHNTDACILRVTSKFRSPVKVDGMKLEIQPERILNKRDMVREGLQRLKCKGFCSIDENVRVLGFNQEGEGLVERGKHVHRTPCMTKGYVSKKMPSESQQNLAELDESQQSTAVFMPNSEIVVICKTISGHSGGPCINLQGEVIGIVSRADPVEKDRSYLVNARQINVLLNKAKTRFETGGYHEFMNRF